MTNEKANIVRIQLLERNELLQEKESFEKSLKLYSDITQLNNQKVNLLTTENDRLVKELGEANATSNFERIVWVSIGVIGTGLVLYTARQSLR